MQLSAAQIDRACGVLLGAACGDALGAGYEFGTATVGPDGPRMIGGGLGGFAPGEWTDDTAMTWVVAEVAASGADLRDEAALDAIARGFRDWYASHPPDIGVQTRAVLGGAGDAPTAATMTAVARDLHVRTGRTAGNGSLMRTAPVALAHLDDPGGLVEAAMKVSALTHYDPLAEQACALWCLAIRHAVLTGEMDVRGGTVHLPPPARAFWEERLDEAEAREPSAFTPNGYVVTALQAAWSAIAHTPVPEAGFPRDQLEAALATAVGIGDDTDTVASIAGALLGARWGASAFPAEWRRIVHGYPGRTAEDLVHLAHLAAAKGPGAYGWPLADRIDYSWEPGSETLAVHPHDSGVLMGGAGLLDRHGLGETAVVSLCLLGRDQVRDSLSHVVFRLIDQPAPGDNPNLDFVIDDAARTIARLRADGHVVLLHCVAAHSRTPAVAIRYAQLKGIDPEVADTEVCDALPAAHPNAAFREALARLAAVFDGG